MQASFLAGLFCFALISCGPKEKVVASVNEKELTEKEALILMDHLGYDSNDDDQYRSFLEDWCEKESYLQELRTMDADKATLVELRSNSFQGELAKYYLEEHLLKDQLDTIVTKQEIKAYYDDHKDEFILSDYLVKALYLKIPNSIDFKSNEIPSIYLLKNDKDLSEVNSYAKLYAQNYYFNDSTWIFFNVLAKDIPLTKYNVDNIVLNRSKTYFSDDDFTYFLNIIDFKLKDEAPPVEFLSEQIKEIIVLQRLQKLKENNESKMIQKIKDKHEITINI
ncbi:MAG: hypothetical protein ACI865_002188 [Flavobacteriaceae bacterium]|jgi:hypothetical protein